MPQATNGNDSSKSWESNGGSDEPKEFPTDTEGFTTYAKSFLDEKSINDDMSPVGEKASNDEKAINEFNDDGNDALASLAGTTEDMTWDETRRDEGEKRKRHDDKPQAPVAFANQGDIFINSII